MNCKRGSKTHRTKRARATAEQRQRLLERVHLNAAGIDVGSEAHWVAVPEDRDERPVQKVSSFTHDLHRLADWLEACWVDTVAMESTGEASSSCLLPPAQRLMQPAPQPLRSGQEALGEVGVLRRETLEVCGHGDQQFAQLGVLRDHPAQLVSVE